MRIYHYGETYELKGELIPILKSLKEAMDFQKRMSEYLVPDTFWMEGDTFYINWVLDNNKGERLWAYEYATDDKIIGHRIDEKPNEPSKIYITGDTHSDFSRLSNSGLKRNGIIIYPQDYVIVCGDFGLLWDKSEFTDYKMQLLANKSYTILWVQGNHENYDMIAEYPIEEWHGGKVRHIIRDKVILLERGQVFEINGKTFFTFGGARSHDIQGGLFDRNDPDFEENIKKASRAGLPYRIINKSWWEAELPTKAEMFEGLKNLGKVDYKVDYVITHCASDRVQKLMDPHELNLYKSDCLTEYFDGLEDRLEYKHWFFGHYHDNLDVDEKHTLLYDEFRVVE